MASALERLVSGLRRTVAHDAETSTERRHPFELTVELSRDELDGGWVAEVVELPGCISQGDTEAEALDNVLDAFRELLSAHLARQHEEHPDVELGRHRETVRVPVAL